MSSVNEWPKHDDILHPGIDEDMNIHQLPGEVVGPEDDSFDNEYDSITNPIGSDGGSIRRNGATAGSKAKAVLSNAMNVTSEKAVSIYSSAPGSNKKKLIFGISFVALVAIIIGVSVGVAKSKESHRHGSGGESLHAANDHKYKANQNEPWYKDRIADVFTFLELYSSTEDLLTESSPQHKAAVWIALKDELHLKTPLDWEEEGAELEKNSSPGVVVKQHHWRFVQRYLLAVFYYATGGDDWKERLNFGNNVHECNWYQMMNVYHIGVQCDDTGEHVVGLIIPENNLSGELPRELFFLQDLRYLIMQNNKISGLLPNDLSNSKGLDVINLSNNNLSGPIPDNFGRIEKLRVLELSDNDLTGSIPSNIKNLENLETINLCNNHIEGNIGVLTQIPSIENIYMSNNQLSGTLDEVTYHNMPNLVDLVLGVNGITGTLPTTIFYVPKLKVLDLHWNSLSGDFPTTLPENNVIEYLSVAHNSISGSINESISNLQALYQLDVSQNNLVGEMIPASMSSMNKLRFLFLDRNPNLIPGEIPEVPLKDMTQLRQLTIGQTNRIGELPPWIGYLSNLELFDVSQHDELTGIGNYYCDTLDKLQVFTANCDLIERCDCCQCCTADDDSTCVSYIYQSGVGKNQFVIPIKSFSPVF